MQERNIIQADALVWMRENPATPEMSVITSLPDVSELALSFEEWRTWFVDAARAVIQWTPPTSVAIFYQSDIRHHSAWIDKGQLIMEAMAGVKEEPPEPPELREEPPAILLWHKIVCRKPPGTIALGRPSYSHLLCITRHARAVMRPGPDVIAHPGATTWSKGMGTAACRVAWRFLREEITTTRVVVDPFCGRGSVLAMANTMGLDAIGIDISGKRCRAARRAEVTPDS